MSSEIKIPEIQIEEDVFASRLNPEQEQKLKDIIFQKDLADINKEIAEKGIRTVDEIMDFEAFGGIDFDDIPESILRGKYKCELTAANLREAKSEDLDADLGHKFWVLDFGVSEDLNYMGESGSLFVHLYTSKNIGQDPETKQILLNGEPLDPKIQNKIREAVKYYRELCGQMGYTRDEIRAGAINFGDKVGEEYMVEMYPDNQKKTRISNQSPIVPVNSTESSELNKLDI